MRFGLGVLRLSPNDFWAMSLPELHAAMLAHSTAQGDAPDRAALERLLRQFPDKEH
jgi:uncharacterized phage protein (TIGR02216 family)